MADPLVDPTVEWALKLLDSVAEVLRYARRAETAGQLQARREALDYIGLAREALTQAAGDESDG